MKTNKQNNKTVNLSRAIMMLVKNVDSKLEKTLLNKIETACYDLIDITHNDETKISNKLNYLSDLMILARQVNLFLEENTIFIIGVISEISKSYETKLEIKNEEIINEKIRDILQGGEMSETQNILSNNPETSRLDMDNRQKEIRREVKDLEKLSETKVNNYTFENKKRAFSENKNIKDIKQEGREVRDFSMVVTNRKLSRKEEVIRALSHTPVSIKDIAEKVLGCSEKTIQRELGNLVDGKVALRIGESKDGANTSLLKKVEQIVTNLALYCYKY